MAEKVIVEYELVQKGGEKILATVEDINQSLDETKDAVNAAFSEKAIEGATSQLNKFNTEVEQTTTQFASAQAELKALTKQITSGQLKGDNLREATKRAAELKDRIGDVRGEISRLASDTRVFDLVLEGGRGIAAAFSVAAGAAALFGKENEELQKTLAKAQGALALLSGAQEVANILTTKGGIATKAYGVGLQVVDAIQKRFAISSAAAWATATAGLSLLLAGLAALYVAYKNNSTAAEEAYQAEKRRREAFGQEFSQQLNSIKQLDQIQENELKRAKLRGDDLVAIEKKQLNERLSLITGLIRDTRYNYETQAIDQKTFNELSQQLETERLNTLLKLRGDQQKKVTQAVSNEQDRELRNAFLIWEENQKLNEERQKQLDQEIADAKAKNDAARAAELQAQKEFYDKQTAEALAYLQKIKEAEEEAAKQEQARLAYKQQLTDAYYQFAVNAATSLSSITSGLFSQQMMNLQKQQDQQLTLAGDNAKQREAIEKRFAVKRAEIARKQAIADKAFSIFQIGIATAQAIQKQIASSGNFITAAPFVALIAASAALQTAAVLSQPLPEIPKFAKGVIGFKGKGTSTSDENLVMISNNESVMTGKATNKYREELQAAQDMELESLIYHKYILPTLKQVGVAEKEASTYDDYMLRKTIKKGHEADRRNSEYVVNGILKGMRQNTYFTQRYLS